MMDHRKYPGKDMQRSIKDLNSYADTLRDASFLFEEKVEELSLLRRIGDIIDYIFDQEVFYQMFVDILLEETNAENCSFMLINADTKKLVLKMARGRNDDGTFFDHPGDFETTFSLGEGVAGRVALERKAILINDVSEDERFEERETCFPIGSLLCSPLIFQKKVLGVINISHSRAHAFSQNNKRVMELLCAFVSLIIGNAIAYIKKRDQEKFKAMFEGIRFSILLMDPETGKIVDCNRYTKEWIGYSKKELVRMEHVFDIVPHECREKAKNILNEVIEKNDSEFYELSFMKKGGSVAISEISGAVISYQERDVIRLTIRDITERKEMEEKLFRSVKLKALGELARGVAHDFNNVLAAILGRAQLLKMILEPPPGKQERRKSVIELKKGLEIIEKASKDGAETVRRIREFSRRGDDDKYFTTINLNEIIDQSLEFTRMRRKGDAESKGIKINIQKEFSTLPSISGSASELREVITNLINNAIDAMPQRGQIKIKTFKEDSRVCIKVEDIGTGIPKAIRDRIFDPFFTTKGVKSSGLGLSVSYGIINRHRGTITVDSVEGEGTTFTIKLPILEKVIEKEQVKPMPEEQRKARILVIEDKEDVRDILSAILIKGGHQVETASDGTQGIELFEKKEFDLVFTDLGMPGISGWEVAEKIKSINKSVPVALITGWNVELNESERRESGVDLIVYKPFEVNQVLRLVREGMVLKDRFNAA